MIDFRNFKEIMECAKKSKTLSNSTYRAESRNKEIWQTAWNKWNDYDQNVYALAIFRTLSLMNPIMVNRGTTKRVSFRGAFGNDFEKLDNGMRGQLIKLVDWGWSSPWVMEESVTTVKCEKITTIKMLDKLNSDGTVAGYEIARKP